MTAVDTFATQPRNFLSLLTKAKDFSSLYKQHPNATCTALMAIGLFPYLINLAFLFGLGGLLQLVGYIVMLFAAAIRNLISDAKTK